MAISPLTKAQQATVLALVEARRLDAALVDASRAASFMRQAEDRLGQLPLLTSVAVKYGIAYDVAHDIGEALLAAYGSATPAECAVRRVPAARRLIPRPALPIAPVGVQ